MERYTKAELDAMADRQGEDDEVLSWRWLAGWDLDRMEVEDGEAALVEDDPLGLLDRIE